MFREAYGPKRKVRLENFEKTRTKQSMKQECDVNFIVAKFQQTGYLEHANEYQGDYGEFEAIDYHEAMNAVIAAQEMFLTVPAQTRKRFNNDPAQFIEFVNDANNREEAIKIGLIPAPKQAAAQAEPEPAPEGE